MDLAESRRANVLALLFLFFLVLTVWCLRAILEPPGSAPAPPPVEVAAAVLLPATATPIS
jgi:hypothetical protein